MKRKLYNEMVDKRGENRGKSQVEFNKKKVREDPSTATLIDRPVL